MRIDLDNDIRISDPLDANTRTAIEWALTIPNPHKDVAQRELLWGADRLDDYLRLYSYEQDGTMVLPIGFKHALFLGLGSMQVQLEVLDHRSGGIQLPPAREIQLRDYQEPMCEALIRGQCGVAEAPTAAGKTAVALEAIRRSQRNALVIVEKASLARQWMNAANEFLDVDVGFIGEGGMRLGPITIALRQALHARRDEFQAQGFFNLWGTVVVDEVHHCSTAWSLIELIQRFTSVNRWGISATPDRNPEYFPILQAVIGPVLWETTMADAAKHLVFPTIKVLDSEFEFDYHPTGWATNPETGARRKVRNNYNAMVAALCADPARNLLIAQAARDQADAGHHVLIVSDRKEHLNRIGELLVTHIPYVLVGGGGSDTYDEVKGEIEQATHGTILLSTVADEGLSIDRLDRVIPAYPRRNVETMRQIVGRVMRPWPGKRDAMVIDVRDGCQELLRSQFRDRAQLLYGKEGWRIQS